MNKPKKTRAPKTRPKKTMTTRERRKRVAETLEAHQDRIFEGKAKEDRLTLEDLKLLESSLKNAFDIESRLVPIDELEERAKLLDAKLKRIIKNENDPNLPPRPAIDVAWMTAADCGFIAYALYHMSCVVKHYTGKDKVWADKLRTRLMLVAKGTMISATPEEDKAAAEATVAVLDGLSREDLAFVEYCLILAKESNRLSNTGRLHAERIREHIGHRLASTSRPASAEPLEQSSGDDSPGRRVMEQLADLYNIDMKYVEAFVACHQGKAPEHKPAAPAEEFDLLRVNATALLDRAQKIIPEDDDLDWYRLTSTGFSIGDCYTLAACVEAAYMLAIKRDPNELDPYECFNTPDLHRLKASLVMAAVAGTVATPPKIGDVVSVTVPHAQLMDQFAAAFGIDSQRLRNFVSNEDFIKNHGAGLMPDIVSTGRTRSDQPNEANAPRDEYGRESYDPYNTLRQLHKDFPVVSHWHRHRPVYIRLTAQDWLITSYCIKAVGHMLMHLLPGGRERIADVFEVDNLDRIRAELAYSALNLTQSGATTKAAGGPSPITPTPTPKEPSTSDHGGKAYSENPSRSPNPEPSTPGTTQTSSPDLKPGVRPPQSMPEQAFYQATRQDPARAVSSPAHPLTTVPYAEPYVEEGSRDKPEGVGGAEAEQRIARTRFLLMQDSQREELAKHFATKDGYEYVLSCTSTAYRDEMEKLVSEWKLEQGVKAARVRFEQMNNDERAEARHVGLTTFFKKDEYGAFALGEMHKLLEAWAAQQWFNARSSGAKREVLDKGVGVYFGSSSSAEFQSELVRLLTEWDHMHSNKDMLALIGEKPESAFSKNEGLSSTVGAHLEFERMEPAARINAWEASSGRAFAGDARFHTEMHELLRKWIGLNTRMVDGKLEHLPEWVTKFVDSLPAMVTALDGAMATITFRASSLFWAKVEGLGKTRTQALLDLRRKIIDSVLSDAKLHDVVRREHIPSIAQYLVEAAERKAHVEQATPLQVAADDA